MYRDILLSFPVLFGGAIFVVFLLILTLYRLRRLILTQSEMRRQESRTLDKSLQKANKQLVELRSVVVGLGQKISEQEQIILHQDERIKELEQQDSDARLYTRASKMVQLGADINELIEECELPKAEAELMLSLQKKLSGEEKVPPLGARPEGGTVKRKAPPKKKSV
ncbi:DUF2802 domain-containing protein [Vibrio ruber]|uniref:DUF2802 domain-containing protein n=1 Tax=Vibrio ruber (strain DSM 16370 / JCM 11486 / BCRC 17186 / CECT 7878 / LMG 23124 / VR1) TaxID=1123498 RepID=A0A1R4LDS5_VIBR1|nr:DUF2802 domain-containing protein [Vibrio ruber]WNJ94699.1 DUF2802 domain-containing protein [Vibrio ruber]SJN54702.1 hypothetical protein VR7878_00891 [Vibrio ruber DSM 16370]